MELRKQGKMDEKVFAETRLRREFTASATTNGQRHDGKAHSKVETCQPR